MKSALRLATGIVLVASFSVVIGVLTITQNLQRILTLWGEDIQMSVYLTENITKRSSEDLEDWLKTNDKVSKLQFVSKEKALFQFREQMASYAPDLLKDDELLKFIPSSFQFSISPNVSSSDQLAVMQEMASYLKVQNGVEDVSFGQDWVQRYANIMHTLGWAGAIFILVIFASALFVISNAIQSSIRQRRDEIEVLELIGATKSYIRKPFLIESALLGGASSLIALIFCYGFFSASKNYLFSQISFLQLATQVQYLSMSSILLLFASSICLSMFAAWICLNRLNDGWAASQRIRGQS